MPNAVLEDEAISDDVPMRCVRRQSAYLNKGKSEELDNLINSYAKEKDYHLRSLTPQVFASYPSQISYRDSLLHRPDGYKSPYGLQARMWKMALKDAYETIEKYWTALAGDIRPLISHKQFWSDSMIHYAYWLLFNPRRVASLYAGNTPIPTRFSITPYYRSIVVKIISNPVTPLSLPATIQPYPCLPGHIEVSKCNYMQVSATGFYMFTAKLHGNKKPSPCLTM